MTILKTDSGSNSSTIREIWISESPSELKESIEKYRQDYDPRAYSTFFTPIHGCFDVNGNYTGKWYTNMSRWTSTGN